MYTFTEIVSTLCKTCEDKEKESKQLREKNKQLKKLLLDIKSYIGVPYWEEKISMELNSLKK